MARLWLLLALLGGCARGADHQTVFPYRFQHEENLRQATVYIRSCGTGFLVSAEFVVTNRHIADCIARRHFGSAMIDFIDGTSMPGQVVGVSAQPYVDLAVIHLRGETHRPILPLSLESHVGRDDVLLSIGNPAPSRWVPTSYRVLAAPSNVPGGLSGVIVLEGYATFGDSGSPLVNLNGELVGVVFARTEGHAYAVPTEPYLVDLLREVSPKRTWP